MKRRLFHHHTRTTALLCLLVISDNMNIQGLTVESRLLLSVSVSNCAE